METVGESILQMFIMTLGAFADIWDEIHDTEYVIIGKTPTSLLVPGKIHWFLFIALLVILLLNLLIAMMG